MKFYRIEFTHPNGTFDFEIVEGASYESVKASFRERRPFCQIERIVRV